MTIQSTPPDLSSVHDDLIYTVTDAHTSDPATYPNYKFIADVFVGAIQVARLKKAPNPVTKVGIFNIGQVVRNYISTTFNPTAAAILAQTMTLGEFNIGVTVKFGEEYGFTEFINVLSDIERKFFNNYDGRMRQTSFNEDSNFPALSDRPLNSTVRCDSAFNLIPMFQYGDPQTLTITVYDGSNTATTTFDYVVPDPVFQDLRQLNFSKTSINAQQPGAWNDSSRYITMQFDVAVIFRFEIECECIHDVYSLHFLNRYGGFETKDFSKVSRKTVQIEKKDFGKLPYTVDSSGVVSYKSANNVFNESRATYSSQYREKMVLNSDFITDEEYRWLQQLIVSPMVYIEMDGNFYPVVIAETNYEPKKVVNDDLTNLTINIEFGDQLNAQYR